MQYTSPPLGTGVEKASWFALVILLPRGLHVLERDADVVEADASSG
jgi:hypothetical protein